MAEFKPNKRKAITRALADQAQQQVDNVVDAIQIKYPEAAAFLGLLQASFGTRLTYKQELLNQFTEYIMDNKDVFTKDVIVSQEFQDGLVVAVDNYFKLRTDEKRELARRIFYDFGKSDEKPIYPLERYDNTLQLISQHGIRLLGFIHTQVPAIMSRYVDRKISTNGNDTSPQNRQIMQRAYVKGRSLNDWIDEYIYERERFDVKPRADGTVWLEDTENFRKEQRSQFTPGLSELEQLGLAKSTQVNGVVGEQPDKYNLTEYGEMFISVIKPGKNSEDIFIEAP